MRPESTLEFMLIRLPHTNAVTHKPFTHEHQRASVFATSGASVAIEERLVMRDWIQESITLKRGLTGAKPEAVCHWAFELAAARPDDDLADLFPGSGAVTRAWATWRGKFTLPIEQQAAE